MIVMLISHFFCVNMFAMWRKVLLVHLKNNNKQCGFSSHQVEEVDGEEGGAGPLSVHFGSSADAQARASESKADGQPVLHLVVQRHRKWEGGKPQHQGQLHLQAPERRGQGARHARRQGEQRIYWEGKVQSLFVCVFYSVNQIQYNIILYNIQKRKTEKV